MNLRLHLYSDLHARLDFCRKIVQRAAQADVVVIAGDIGNLRLDLEAPVEALSAIQKPAVLVPGNSESLEELQQACRNWRSAVVLHGSSATVAGVTFFGLGGGIPITPFGDWSWDFSDREAETLLSGCPPGCVLVTHSPPYAALDDSPPGRRLGSRSIRAAVERLSPRLVVCGHIHSRAGQRTRIGRTTVINAGPHGVAIALEI